MDACATHGDAMVEALCRRIDDEQPWGRDDAGEWWLLLHSAFILGRISSESAGLLLVHLMGNMDECGDSDLQDWLAGDWSALFANKPRAVIDAVRELAEDRSLDWYIRCQGVDVILDAGRREGDAALEGAIDWAAALAHDESDEWLFRICTACDLLDFPRARHRAWLETMAREEQRRQAAIGDLVGVFTVDDVESAFAKTRDEPNWLRRGDPWKFYDPDAIAGRQRRWAEEDARLFDRATIPHVRATAKVGRNEPCPCGSGKKYKRCRLARDEVIEATTLRLTLH